MEALLDTPAQLQATLRKLKACEPGLTWSIGKTYAEAWATCQDSEWMLWLLTKTNSLNPILNERLVCRFAREVLHLNPDPRVLACIETREAWADRKATDAARAAARAAAWDAAWDAAGAWAAARDAAWDAARDAARAAAWAAAGAAARIKQCDIIRELTLAPIL